MKLTKVKEYNVWRNLRRRCLTKTNPIYKYYGGRGIKVCKRWNSYNNFISDMGKCPKGFQIDRINCDGDYKPSNCRWVDRKTQMRNLRRCVKITIKGVTKTRSEWAEIKGVNHSTVRKRIARGHDLERAFSKINHKYKNEKPL